MTQYYIPQDKVPIPPPDAEVFTTCCDYCVVACGYKVYRWPLGKEGGPKAKDNALLVDFPLEPLGNSGAAWYGPNNHNVVMANGRPHNIIVVADAETEAVNLKGDHSIRGGCIAQKPYNPSKPTRDRLQRPMIRIFDSLMPVSWDFATDIHAELSKYVIEKYGASAWAHKQYSYQFWENTYALTKLALRHIETPAFAPHDQPGPGGDAIGLRDTGFAKFAPAYWDYAHADVLFISGTDPFETKTVLWNEWILPAIKDKKRKMKVIMVQPRRTPGSAFAEANGGLILQLIPGTDTVLYMAITRQIIEMGGEDKKWIKKWTNNEWETDSGFGQGTRNTPWQWRTTWGKFETSGYDNGKKSFKTWLFKQKESDLKTAAKITGVPAAKIKKAAEMMSQKPGGKPTKVSICLEKGNYWSNNYGNTVSISFLAIVTGTGGRPGRMIGRLGGHQRGGRSGGRYPRAKGPEKNEGRRKKPIDLDRWLVSGHVRFANVVGTTWISAMAGSQGGMADTFKRLTRMNPNQVRSFVKSEIISTLKKRVDSGGMVVADWDIYLRDPIGAKYADIVFPAAGWGEEDFTRANGERRCRLYSKFYDSPGDAKPDWWIAAQIGKKMGFPGFDWKDSNQVFEETGRFSRRSRAAYDTLVFMAKKNGMKGHELLKLYGTTGIQAPIHIFDKDWAKSKDPKIRRPGWQFVGDKQQQVKKNPANGKPIEWRGGVLVGTVRQHDTEMETPPTGHRDRTIFNKRELKYLSQTGKLNLLKSPWDQFSDFWEWWKPKGDELWVTNGRVNEVWQTGFDDMFRRPYITQRFPENFLEIHPEDAKARGIESGDMLAITCDRVPVQKDYNQSVFSGDFQFSSLMKQGHIKLTKGSITGVAIVTPAMRKGVSFTYFQNPHQPANALVPMVPDWVTNRYRFKLGVGKVKKIGESPYKKTFRAFSFVRRDIV
ncbi:MAG: molybdopterin-dependent oxidoreductase [Nitrospinota bacterium]